MAAACVMRRCSEIDGERLAATRAAFVACRRPVLGIAWGSCPLPARLDSEEETHSPLSSGRGRIYGMIDQPGADEVMSHTDGMALATAWKAEAHHLGFDLVGLTSAEPPGHLDVYRAWLEAGRLATMSYLAGERALTRRSDLRRILPGCTTVLVVGLRYPPPVRDGPIAAYALGQDYHDVIPARLRTLVGWLEQQVGRSLPHRIYTDTGPLLERELGQRAGLGWIGKNTCLIHPRLGSTFLLGEILLSLSLPPDPPMVEDRCGRCTRCLEACPTACIRPDRTLDAARCLSYLTIERRGDIPLPLRAAVGPWLFGCDVCQRVCPWNARFAAPPEPAAWPRRPDLERLTARDFLDADPLQVARLDARHTAGTTSPRRSAAQRGRRRRQLRRPVARRSAGASVDGGSRTQRARPRRLGTGTPRRRASAHRTGELAGRRTAGGCVAGDPGRTAWNRGLSHPRKRNRASQRGPVRSRAL